MTRWLEELVAAEPGATVLHSHFTAFDLPAVKVAAKRPDTRVFWHVHTVLGSNATVQLRNRVKLSMLARRVELILCVAQHLADAVRARGAPGREGALLPQRPRRGRLPAGDRTTGAGLRAGASASPTTPRCCCTSGASGSSRAATTS